MGTKVHGLYPWDELTRVSKLQGPRYAAFAFIGAEAPDMLALEEGDVLVCNASEGAIRNGATNPHALKEFLDRGVQMYSCGSLHAKILAVRNSAAVGSANASFNSQSSLESVVVSNEPAFIKDVRGLVENAKRESAPIGQEYLDMAVEWVPNKPHSVPQIAGVTSPPPLEDVYFPELGCRYWLAVERQEQYSREEEAAEQSLRHLNRGSSLETKFVLDPFVVDGEVQAKRGDVFILVHEGEKRSLELVWEPAKVVGSRQVNGQTPSTMYLLRYNRGHATKAISNIEYALDEIQELTAIDLRNRTPGAAPVELSDSQGADVVAALWGEQI